MKRGANRAAQTVLKCYHKADEATMRAAMEARASLHPDGLLARA
jgi:hypothetical protein